MRLIQNYIADLPAILIEEQDVFTEKGLEITEINGKKIDELFPNEKPIVTFSDDYHFPSARSLNDEGVYL